MARAPDKRIGQAKAMYLKGKKLVEIANELKLPEGTVRRWKSTHKWGNERADNHSERSEWKANIHKEKQKAVAEEVMQVIENPALTDKQRLFCLHYIRCFNATKAYQKAYECSYETAMVEGWNSLRNPKIRDEITRLKQNRMNRELLDEQDVFQKYMDIAFSDITDYLTFGQKEVEYIDKAGKERTAVVSYVDLQDSASVDGTIISEVSQGKDGVKVKLADRMKALQWVAEHMDLATEEQKARIEVLRAKVEDKGEKPIHITFTRAGTDDGE